MDCISEKDIDSVLEVLEIPLDAP